MRVYVCIYIYIINISYLKKITKIKFDYYIMHLSGAEYCWSFIHVLFLSLCIIFKVMW